MSPLAVTPDRRLGVVLSDGGAKGAYEVGVMKAIVTGASPTTGFRPVEPGIFTGTSVGGYNAAVMASQPGVSSAETIAFLEAVWRQRIAGTPTRCGNGIFRLRGVPLQGFDPACLLHPAQAIFGTAADSVFLAGETLRASAEFALAGGSFVRRFASTLDFSAFFSAEPFVELLSQTISSAGIRDSGRYLAVAATNWSLGEVRVFESNELASSIGQLALLATASIPGIFPPVNIGSTQFVDGALLMNTPLRPAIVAGAQTLHVVYLDPLLVRSDLGSGNTLDVLARTYSIMTAARVRDDLEDAARINRGIELLRNLERGQAISDDPSVLRALGGIESVVRRRQTDRPRRLLTIHRYRPETDLGLGVDLLNFEIDHIQRLIEQGYQDAVDHNCQRSGCLVVSAADSALQNRDFGPGHIRTRRSRRARHA